MTDVDYKVITAHKDEIVLFLRMLFDYMKTFDKKMDTLVTLMKKLSEEKSDG